MHACIRWVCSFKTLHQTLVRVYVKVRNGIIINYIQTGKVLHLGCWYMMCVEFLEYPLFVCVCVCVCLYVCVCVCKDVMF